MCDRESHLTAREIAMIFNSSDDHDALSRGIETVRKDIGMLEVQNSKVKKILQALAKLSDEENKTSVVQLQKSNKNDEVVSKLEEKKFNAEAGVNKLNEVLGSLENSMRKSDEEAAKLSKEKQKIEQGICDVLPQTKYAFSLFSNITKIRWDYDVEGGDQLRGFVTSLHDVRPFCLNVKEHSSYFVANYLWDVVTTAKNSRTVA